MVQVIFFEIIVLFICYGNFLNLYLIIYFIVLKSVYFSIFFIFNVKKCELCLQWLYIQKDNVWVYFKGQYLFIQCQNLKFKKILKLFNLIVVVDILIVKCDFLFIVIVLGDD